VQKRNKSEIFPGFGQSKEVRRVEAEPEGCGLPVKEKTACAGYSASMKGTTKTSGFSQNHTA
jgi:hypothetical protein